MTPAARALQPYIRRQWKALAGAGAATGVLTAADLAKPWPLAIVVDQLLVRDAPFALDGGDWRMLAGVALLVLLIALSEAAALYFSNLWLQTAGERISHELRIAVDDHLQRLSLAFHQRRQKGDLLTRVTGDVNAMGDLFAQQLGAITQAALLSLGMTVVLLVLDPVLALVSLATTPALLAISSIYRRRVRSTARVRRAHEGRIASMAGEALSAMAVVKAFGSERIEADRVRAGSEQRMAVGVDIARLQAGFDGLVGAVRAVGTALVIAVGVMRVAAGALSPGELLVFVSYTRKAYSPLKSLARETTKVAATMAKAERVAEILAADDVLEERPGAHRGGRAAGDVALERVSFAYEPSRPVLHDVSLTIPAGRCVALVGPSGAGKSTLGALVARFHDPTAGRVLIDGRDARDCALDWLRAQVTMLLQDTVLFTGTVRENIAYGSDASDDEIAAAARAAVAHAFICELPDGYDTELGPQGVGLSGGQRQRIGIARTLLRDPPILLLDEPTTALDAAAEAQLLDGLKTLMRGRTTILVSHSPRLTRLADRVVRLDRGRVVARRRALDPALPQLERMLDADAMAEVLDRSLEASLGEVTVSRVVYKPGELVAVHYRADVGDAVATCIAGVDLAERARRPQYAERARRIDGRSPASNPLWYDDDLGTLVTWLPFDPRLPALGETTADLARGLAAGGDESSRRLAARLAVRDVGEPILIGYKPRGRAVLRLDGFVLKAYGRERQFEAALAGLRAAQDGPLPTPAFAGAVPELRLTAQERIEGRVAGEAAEVAAEAGAMAATLQRAGLSPAVAAPPEKLLDAALRKAELVETVMPELADRLDGLVRRLGDSLPAGLPLVPAHGDFHVDQLLVRESEIAVVDFDGLCVAAPALDLATYAADVVRGRPADHERVQAVLEPLLEGYGGRPEALDWHLAAAVLARAAHPFQRQVTGWQQRVEATVAVAEASLG
jgi:ATP-binding cassette subfamily B protein